ncbi:hypothetical protein GCM10027258_62300 [Amycolatopsis stemonae]
MAKQSGLGWTTFSVDDSGGTARDIRNDTTNLDFDTPRATQDVTGLDKSAKEELLLLADFTGTATGVFNAAATKSHDVLKTVPSTSVNRTISLGVGGVSLANECVLTGYSLKRSASGELTWDAPFMLADGAVPTWA